MRKAAIVLAAQLQGNDRDNTLIATREGDSIESRGGDDLKDDRGEAVLLRGDAGRDLVIGGLRPHPGRLGQGPLIGGRGSDANRGRQPGLRGLRKRPGYGEGGPATRRLRDCYPSEARRRQESASRPGNER